MMNEKRFRICLLLICLCFGCGNDPFKDYSAAIMIHGEWVQMKLYGRYNVNSQWNDVRYEILDRVIALHSPKKVLIVIHGDTEDSDSFTTCRKVQKYLKNGGCELEIRDERKAHR